MMEKAKIYLPWEKLWNDWEVGRPSDSTHKKNNIWMTQPTHYPYLATKGWKTD